MLTADFFINSLSSLAILAGLEGQCPPPQKVVVDVKLVVKESPYITDVSSQWLTDNFANDPDGTLSTDGQWMVGGLTKSNISGQFSASFAATTEPVSKNVCLSLRSVNYYITYEPVIYIASDYKHMACRYSQTLAHEKRHVATDKKVINQYIPQLKAHLQKIARGIKSQGPYNNAQAPVEQNRILAELSAATDPLLQRLIATRRAEQAKIDTLENYKRDTALCPGQFPQFQTKAQ